MKFDHCANMTIVQTIHKCRTMLTTYQNIKSHDNQTLQDIEQALASGKALFIKFSATWCSPCKALKPKLGEAAQQFAEQANFVEFDVDEDDEALCADLRINSVPTIVAFKISTQ